MDYVYRVLLIGSINLDYYNGLDQFRLSIQRAHLLLQMLSIDHCVYTILHRYTYGTHIWIFAYCVRCTYVRVRVYICIMIIPCITRVFQSTIKICHFVPQMAWAFFDKCRSLPIRKFKTTNSFFPYSHRTDNEHTIIHNKFICSEEHPAKQWREYIYSIAAHGAHDKKKY